MGFLMCSWAGYFPPKKSQIMQNGIFGTLGGGKNVPSRQRLGKFFHYVAQLAGPLRVHWDSTGKIGQGGPFPPGAPRTLKQSLTGTWQAPPAKGGKQQDGPPAENNPSHVGGLG